MINILIFDDRFGVRESFWSGLTAAFPGKVKLIACKDVYEANEAIRSNSFNVVIVDSMMSTLGLAPDQEKYTKEGLLTGIVWLCGIHNNSPEKLQDSLIFVVSGYVDDCKKAITSLDEYTQNSHFIDNSIELVSKSGDYINHLIKKIKGKFII